MVLPVVDDHFRRILQVQPLLECEKPRPARVAPSDAWAVVPVDERFPLGLLLAFCLWYFVLYSVVFGPFDGSKASD